MLQPGDDGYPEARAVWNGMIDRHPAAIAQCAGTADVAASINFARELGIPLSVKGGGHHAAGKAVCDDGLVIDLSRMNSVRVDPTTRTARVGPGARWGGFDHEAQHFGLATTGGVDSRTGVAGLTLGGGIGWLARSHGLAVDNLLEADVVTAEGKLVHASATENPDLFWGLRGGGGNFGVVTSFRFQLHKVGPEILVAQAFHRFEDGPEVLRFYRDFMAGAPDEVACYAFVLRVPPVAPFPKEHHGEKSVALIACYSGEVDRGSQALAPVHEVGNPIVAFAAPMPYTEFQQAFDAGYPNGARYYGKSTYIEELSDELIEGLLSVTRRLPGPMTGVFFECMGGAIGRVAPSETAFPHRTAPFNLSVNCGWTDPSQDNEIRTWATAFYDTVLPYSTGGTYVNYLEEDDADASRSAYRENYDRLAALKARWDRGNLFSMNQNVPPA